MSTTENLMKSTEKELNDSTGSFNNLSVVDEDPMDKNADSTYRSSSSHSDSMSRDTEVDERRLKSFKDYY